MIGNHWAQQRQCQAFQPCEVNPLQHADIYVTTQVQVGKAREGGQQSRI
jgi:hypothetical protein